MCCGIPGLCVGLTPGFQRTIIARMGATVSAYQAHRGEWWDEVLRMARRARCEMACRRQSMRTYRRGWSSTYARMSGFPCCDSTVRTAAPRVPCCRISSPHSITIRCLSGKRW